MLEGQEYLEKLHRTRMDHLAKNDQPQGGGGSLSTVSYDKNFNLTAKDLIMMNVTEKLNYLQKRKAF